MRRRPYTRGPAGEPTLPGLARPEPATPAPTEPPPQSGIDGLPLFDPGMRGQLDLEDLKKED